METDYQDSSEKKREEEDAVFNQDTLEAFTTAGFKMLVDATKKSNALPSGQARDLYECYPSFHAVVKNQADYVLSMLSEMMKSKCYRSGIQTRDDEDKFEMIVECNDSLLENVGIALDELSGVRKNPEAQFISRNSELVNCSWNKSKKVEGKPVSQVLNKILIQAKNIEKPQLKFKDKVNNDSNVPFEPKIKYKYNMLKPLALILEKDEDGISQFCHPYEFELEKFKPLEDQLKPKPPILYKPLEETPLICINTPQDVTEMVKYLEAQKEIAVDLEHHSYRSFQGFTCLIQISSRDRDYIIDTLCLRSDLEMLNKVFTNPLIVKVFHGADSDVLWLQKDLGLYVVNMFDTHQATKLLHFPKLSLSYLLAHYCNVKAQKQFQLADWRIRPLPEELLTYAREDTHYLLYIYDNLRNALLEKANNQTNLLESVISESARICLKRYVKPIYKSDDYLDLYHRSKKLFDNRQKSALQRLFEWRDKTAREWDESYAYILPDHMMLNVSELLPREAQGILACCNPVPTPVRQNLLVLHQMILKAREQPLIKPVLEEQRFYKFSSSMTSMDNPLQCPHDLNRDGEFRDDLPVLIQREDANTNKNNFSYSAFLCSKPIIDVFESTSTASGKKKFLSAAKKVMHITPYYRYKFSKKFLESEEVKGLNSNINQNAEKEKQNALSANEDPNNSINGSKNVEDAVKAEKDAEDEAEEEEVVRGNKRQTENSKTKPAKKVKVEEDNGCAIDEQKEPETESKKKKKKKKLHTEKKTQGFQPFDYKSVDYKKYQSSQVFPSLKVQKKCKLKKKGGKKNFKISV